MYEESANINVFFCYTRQDYHITKEINNTIIKSGYTSFIDADFLLPGFNFVNTIQENIIKSRFVFVSFLSILLDLYGLQRRYCMLPL
mgnify:CR=1 FL=1